MAIIVVDDKNWLIRECPWDVANTRTVCKCPMLDPDRGKYLTGMDCLFCKHATLSRRGKKEKLMEMQRIDGEIDEKANKSIDDFLTRG